MAKKFNFSITNKDLCEMEKISQRTGKKLIEIIRSRYERGKKSENLAKKYSELLEKINTIKFENDKNNLKLLSIIEVIARQNVFSNEVLMGIVKGNKNETELFGFKEIVEKKSEEFIRKVRNTYLEN